MHARRYVADVLDQYALYFLVAHMSVAASISVVWTTNRDESLTSAKPQLEMFIFSYRLVFIIIYNM